MDYFNIDFGEPNPVFVAPSTSGIVRNNPDMQTAEARALREAADALDKIGDGELDPALTSEWLRIRADRIANTPTAS